MIGRAGLGLRGAAAVALAIVILGGSSPLALAASPAQQRVEEIFLAHGKVSEWLSRYPSQGRVVEAARTGAGRWIVSVSSGRAGVIATGRVNAVTGQVEEALTGPQVAWQLARGGQLGGKILGSAPVWLGFCLVFFLGLADLRRVRSLRNLDLLALLSFSISLWFLNRGDVFTSAALVYPPLVYLLVRVVGIARGDGVARRAAPARWPVWLLVAMTIFLTGFRVGLNLQTSEVIDVGYAGVIGADRLAHQKAPYGRFPKQRDLPACGARGANGEIRARLQANGRCESPNPTGDTYGPVNYVAYLPAYVVAGWSGRWDRLPAAHWTSILFDLACIAGLALCGWRYGGVRLGATLAFAWASYPFTQLASTLNTNDAIMPALLLLGFFVASSPGKRASLLALSAWTKFAALAVAPLWLSYPEWRPARRPAIFAGAFAAVTAASFAFLLLEPSPLQAANTFFDRTIKSQVSRQSPFSLWDWGSYYARGLPDLHLVQWGLGAALAVAAIAAAFVPRRKSLLQLAALTGALLLGFELVLTHWFYTYILWFFPFVAFALFAGAREEAGGLSRAGVAS